MMARRKKEKSFYYTGGSASRPPGFNANLPSQAAGGDCQGGSHRPDPGLAPESALRLHPCRALSSAPVSTSLRRMNYFAKRVVVANREK